ncbi:MAG: M23 family metallopeptidase [Candidatus Sulfopaludibacter sp.]|nr:M23 family metallopeptidase [Candidatus Sulfopaludibacter sp.]
MRGSTFAAFALGFVAGMAVLAGVLWSFGALRTPAGAQPQAAVAAVPQQAAPPQPITLSPAQGEAERSAPEPVPGHPIIPVQGIAASQLTDNFNDRRDGRRHDALDIPAPRGTPVIAAVEGNVVKLFHSKLGGTTVYQFDDSRTYCYYYAHLERYATGLAEGTLLRQAEVLGYVGSTGNAQANAPHLHFEVHKLGPEKKWWQGESLDPLKLLGHGPE